MCLYFISISPQIYTDIFSADYANYFSAKIRALNQCYLQATDQTALKTKPPDDRQAGLQNFPKSHLSEAQLLTVQARL